MATSLGAPGGVAVTAARAVFTQGSTMRHVVVMTGASATGLLAMFGVDMIDMYFLTLLGEQELAAAVGYAGTLLFFMVSVSIGLQIALGALVARSEGAHRRDLARRYCSSALTVNALVSGLLSAIARFHLRSLDTPWATYQRLPRTASLRWTAG